MQHTAQIHMSLYAIAACDSNRGMGIRNQLPWRLPDDLQHFKQMTLHHPIIMGRKTFESLPKALPQRTNLILSQHPPFHTLGPHVQYTTLNAVLEKYYTTEPIAFVIGGEQIYKLLLPFCSKLFLTILHQAFEVDTYFPAFEKDFHITQSRFVPTPIAHTFYTFERLS